MANTASTRPRYFGPLEGLSPEARAEQEGSELREVARWKHRCVRMDAIRPDRTTTEAQDIRRLSKPLVHLEREQADKAIRFQVANASVYRREAARSRDLILQLLDSSDEYDRKIRAAKIDIEELRSQIRRANDELAKVLKAYPSDFVHAESLDRSCRELAALESRLHHVRTQEGKTHAANRKLRGDIESMLEERKRYQQQWLNYVQQLDRNRKFLIDMIERATLAFNQSEDLCHRIESLQMLQDREHRLNVNEMIETERHIVGTRHVNEFLRVKQSTRLVAELDRAVVRKRNRFKHEHQDQIVRYGTVIDDTKNFLQLESMREVLEEIEKQQDQYMALFRYKNETDARIAEASEMARELEQNNERVYETERRKRISEEQKTTVKEERLQRAQEKTARLRDDLTNEESSLELKLEAVEQALSMLGYDRAKTVQLMGGTKSFDRAKLTEDALRKALAAIERRMMELVELRTAGPPIEEDKPISTLYERQQCAECAEGQDVNQHDEHIVLPTEYERMVANVRERMAAPETQYRLHTLSQCKLPRSRMLVNKRYQ
ncbi:myosin-6 [Anopheles bellator]|uniref:myosin-6 n=1 Tax=Anopheles bellator TaxID=139047 RepID=UPI002648D27A|nr:myosin-6 [Anopheles bellator]